MAFGRTLLPYLAFPLAACAHTSTAAPPVESHLDQVVRASEPAPTASEPPSVLAEGALTIDVPGLASLHDDNVEVRGSLIGDVGDCFYSVHWRRTDGPVDLATMRRVAAGLRVFQGTTFEELALDDGRPALRARTTSDETGDHKIGLVFGVGPFLMVVSVARLEAYADEQALRAANSVREISP